jgi:hypothetical protein
MMTHIPPGIGHVPRPLLPRFLLFGFEFGAVGGSVLGAVLTPLMSWILLRRVALHRAIRETVVGVVFGIAIGAVFSLQTALSLGLVGFVLAGGRLWWSSRPRIRHREAAI